MIIVGLRQRIMECIFKPSKTHIFNFSNVLPGGIPLRELEAALKVSEPNVAAHYAEATVLINENRGVHSGSETEDSAIQFYLSGFGATKSPATKMVIGMVAAHFYGLRELHTRAASEVANATAGLNCNADKMNAALYVATIGDAYKDAGLYQKGQDLYVQNALADAPDFKDVFPEFSQSHHTFG